MLTITVPATEVWNEITNEFVRSEEVTLELEHSLVSLSKWESKFEKPFLGKEERTRDETIGYIEAMCLTPEVPSEVFYGLTKSNLDEISKYIGAKMTATWFKPVPSRPNPEIITAEIIYYWMVAMQISLECQFWHLNRLLTLIKVTNEKNQPAKKNKMSLRDMAAQRSALNEQRLREHNTSG